MWLLLPTDCESVYVELPWLMVHRQPLPTHCWMLIFVGKNRTWYNASNPCRGSQFCWTIDRSRQNCSCTRLCRKPVTVTLWLWKGMQFWEFMLQDTQVPWIILKGDSNHFFPLQDVQNIVRIAYMYVLLNAQGSILYWITSIYFWSIPCTPLS